MQASPVSHKKQLRDELERLDLPVAKLENALNAMNEIMKARKQ